MTPIIIERAPVTNATPPRPTATTRVGVVASSGTWRPALQAHLEHHVERIEVVVIRDPHLLTDEPLDVVIVDDASVVVGANELALLARRSIPVIGLYHLDGEGRGVEFLRSLGIADCYRADLGVSELAVVIGRHERIGVEPAESDRGEPLGDPSGDAGSERFARLDALADQVFSPTRVVTIGGVSERRHELAAMLAAGYGRDRQAMVVDLDPFRPRLARRFRLQLQPNVLVACRSLGDDFDPMHFVGRRTMSSVELPFWTLVGMPSPESATQIDPRDLERLIERLSATWPRLVLVTDSSTGRHEARPLRAVAIRQSTTLLITADPTPEGVLECLDWMVQSDAIAAEERIAPRPADIAFCGRPKDRRRRIEIADQLREHRPHGSVRRVVFVPWDEARVGAASWDGRQIDRRSRMNQRSRRLAQLLTDGTAKRLEVL